MRFKIYF